MRRVRLAATAVLAMAAGAAYASAAMRDGGSFSLDVALSLLQPSTGFAPEDYGFNLWPRSAGGNPFISDFAPDNANLSAAPEPMSWALMLAGFAAVGSLLRARSRSAGLAKLRA